MTATTRNFAVAAGINALGIEPAANVAKVAVERHSTLVKFFERPPASWYRICVQADLLLGNNVLAHVPDLNDFVHGMKILLKPRARSPWNFHIS